MRQVKRKLITTASIAILSCGLAAPSQAQCAEAPPRDNSEIIVTAQRTEQRLIDVPGSISVLDSSKIAEKGVSTLRDFQYSVPNLIFTGVSAPGEGNLSIRGIAVNGGGVGFESGAGVYIDDVYQGRASANSRTLVDADRVEVLRGPQGTLYGKNTIAGAINIVTVQPSNEVKGRGTIGYGRYNALEAGGYISGPLSDAVGAKAVGYYDRRDGFYRNDFDRRNNSSYEIYGGKLQVTIKPTSALTVDLTVDYDRTKDDYIGFEVVDTGLPQFGTTGFVAGNRTIAQTSPTSDRELWGASARIGYEFDDGHRIMSISAYRSDLNSGSGDLDRTELDISEQFGRNKTVTKSQEFRLNSPSKQRFRYVLGVYGLFQKADEATRTGGGLDFDGDGQPDIVDIPYAESASVRTDSFAVFGNLEYDLTDRLTASAGLRYNYERRRFNFSQLGAASFNFAQAPLLTDSLTDQDVTPVASLRYAVGPTTNIYGRIAFGTKSGGWNTRFIPNNIDLAYPTDPNSPPRPLNSRDVAFSRERLVNYEAGIKGSVMGRRLTYDVSVFYLDYTDIQVAQFDVSGASRISNAAAARSYGFEAQFDARMTPWFSLNAGVGYTNARFRDFPTVFLEDDGNGGVIPRTVNLRGLPLLQAPDWTVNAGATFTVPLSEAGKIAFSPEFSYRSSRLTDATDDPFFVIPSATLVNARLSWSDKADRIEVTAWVDNIFNVTFAEERIVENLLFGPQVLEAYNVPRTFGLRATVKF